MVFEPSTFGRIEALMPGYVRGWAESSEKPDTPLMIEILVNGEVSGSGPADILREDLAAKSGGAGRYGFRIPLKMPINDRPLHVLMMRVCGERETFGTSAVVSGTDLARHALIDLDVDDLPPVVSVVRQADGSRRTNFNADAFEAFVERHWGEWRQDTR